MDENLWDDEWLEILSRKERVLALIAEYLPTAVVDGDSIKAPFIIHAFKVKERALDPRWEFVLQRDIPGIYWVGYIDAELAHLGIKSAHMVVVGQLRLWLRRLAEKTRS